MVEQLTARVAEAVDMAVLLGLLKRTPQGGLVHTPFALTPCPIDAETHRRVEALTWPFNRLAHAVSRRLDFLEEALGDVAATDGFTAELLRMALAAGSPRALRMQITRSDYFLQAPPDGSPGGSLPDIRQVELNTISASYAGSAARTLLLHRHLLAGSGWGEALCPNDPHPALVAALAEAFRRYGHSDGCMVMVVQPGEANVFDQRMLEADVTAAGIPVIRRSLEQIAAEGNLKEGHLSLGGRVAAITYFRAGYAPEDHRHPDALRARELIEHSSTVSIPDLPTHLAGTKKVQQLLTDGATLRQFCGEADAQAMEAAFAGIYTLDHPMGGPHGDKPAWHAALEHPAAYVLKPQREGGGNNLYDDDLATALRGLSATERLAYILMDRIAPLPHHAAMVLEGKVSQGKALSEIGRFGVLLAEGDTVVLNEDTGYLVRTKAFGVKEGGVSAGFAHLNSLMALPPEEAYASD